MLDHMTKLLGKSPDGSQQFGLDAMFDSDGTALITRFALDLTTSPPTRTDQQSWRMTSAAAARMMLKQGQK